MYSFSAIPSNKGDFKFLGPFLTHFGELYFSGELNYINIKKYPSLCILFFRSIAHQLIPKQPQKQVIVLMLELNCPNHFPREHFHR
jgi:hypothetical protein